MLLCIFHHFPMFYLDVSFRGHVWLREPLEDYLLGLEPEEKALQQLETEHRFKQAERARAEEVGLAGGSGPSYKET